MVVYIGLILYFVFLLYFLLYLITPIISDFYNEPSLDFLIKILGISIIINSIGLQFRTIETKNMTFRSISIIDIIASVISLVFAIFLAKLIATVFCHWFILCFYSMSLSIFYYFF